VNSKTQAKRLLLRLLLKLMAGSALLMLLWVLFAAAFQRPDLPRMATLWVDLREVSVGEVVFVQWRQHRVLILRRTAEMQSVLERGAERERAGDYSVLLAVGALNCPLRYQAADGRFFLGQPWLGGFVDLCDGSRYDVAGRVFKDQAAGEDVHVPAYRLDNGGLLLGAKAQ